MRHDTPLRPDQPSKGDHSSPGDDDRWLTDMPNDLASLSLSTDSDDEAHPATPDDWDVANLSGDADAPTPRHRHEDCGI